ncbi:MAG TPA: nuclear transport factor 2 family protein [Ktedonobacteraceae bacterium]|nr:nuclear transport factor 2 family protein [Ktedonobacteraceae bacterium]
MSFENIDTVKSFMSALEGNDFDQAADYLADTFIFSGWTPQPLDKRSFMGLMQGLKSGIPGLIFNLHNVDEQDNKVTGTLQIAGYQTASINLPQLNLPPVPQMGRSVSLPTENVEYTLANDQIVRIDIERVSGGGVAGLLHQLGVDIPYVL